MDFTRTLYILIFVAIFIFLSFQSLFSLLKDVVAWSFLLCMFTLSLKSNPTFLLYFILFFFGNQGGEMIMHFVWETMLPMRRKKSNTISYTEQRTTPISTPISTKEKEWRHEKKRRLTPGARKSKQRKKQEEVKRKQNN